MRKFVFIVFFTTSFTTLAQLESIKDKLKAKPKSEQTAIWLCDTAFSFYKNDPKTAQLIAELALQKAEEWESELGMARAHHVLGVAFWARDDYTESVENYLEALKYYEKVGNTRGMALVNMNIGNIYDDLDQPERSKSYLRMSSKMIRQLGDSSNLARVLNNLAIVHRRTNRHDSAYYYYREVMDIRKAMQDSVGVARTYNNISMVSLEKGPVITLEDASTALDNLVLGFEYLKEDDDKRLYATMSANLGRSLSILGQTEDAKSYLDNALEIALEYDFKIIQQWVYMYYVELYKRTNDYRKAVEYMEKETSIDKDLRNAEVSEQIDELNIKYETAKKERKVAELERQNAIEKGIRNMLIIGVISTAIVAFIIVFYIIMKRRKDRMISQLQLQQLSDQITSKNKEIASYTMSFLQKNQLMEELKEQINQLKKSSDISTNKELTRINRIVDNTFRSDEEWKTFQITFDQMHDGFFRDLKKAFPDISNAELKLCALLRLNMNLKESSKILGIAADSVKTARYRLRKKLGLKTEDNLVDFLIQFDNPSEETK